jgi:hypothetical protein
MNKPGVARLEKSTKGGIVAMDYERPELSLLGYAATTIQSSKPNISESSLMDPAPIGDSELIE